MKRLLSVLILPVVAFAQSGASQVGLQTTSGDVKTNVQAAMNSAFLYDVGYSTLTKACTAAVANSKTLYITRTWSGLTTQSLACNIYALTGGIIKPASGQTIALTGSFGGDLTQHFDLSAGGTVNLDGAIISATYPQWFGAVCGTASGPDSTTAVQTTFNLASSKIVFPCQLAISNTVYLPSNRPGLIIEGVASGPAILGPQGGLVAMSSASSFQMFAIYSGVQTIRDFYLNCSSKATSGYVLVSAISGRFFNDRVSNCTSDGWQFNMAGGAPTTTLTSGITSGVPNPVFTVVNAALPGYPLSGGTNSGGNYCPYVMLDYGTVNEEALGFTRSGNTLTLVGTPANNHAIGATARCNGNNDQITLYSPEAFGNAGWGINMFGGSDENGIQIFNPDMESNSLGGMLLTGSVNYISGGNSQGNGGPAYQLGDLNGGVTGGSGRLAVAFVIDGPMDMENNLSSFNTVLSVCDAFSHVRFKAPSELTFYGGGFCPDQPVGNTTLGSGYGVNSNESFFEVKNSAGVIQIDPNSESLRFYDVTGTTLNNSYGRKTTTSPAGFGGPVYTTNTQVNFIAPNYIQNETGSNNALAVALTYGPSNTPVPLTDGLRLQIHLAHTLASGTGNTLSVNGGSPVPLSNNCNPTTFSIGKAFAVNGFLDAVYSGANGYWEVFGVCP